MGRSLQRTRIVIVGGGASGALAAGQLRRHLPEAAITVVDSSGSRGTGSAYGTADPGHLLNLTTSNMSAWPELPDHFSKWVETHGVPAFDGFAPRSAYGRYLGEILASANAHMEGGEVISVLPGVPARLALADGRTLAADSVVLATGRPPGTAPEPIERALSKLAGGGSGDRIVADPWAPGAMTRLVAARPARVLVVGSGLTGIDVALPLIARDIEVALVSRHGQLPRRHRVVGPPLQGPAISSMPSGFDLETLRSAMQDDISWAQAQGGNWRQVVDGLRPRTSQLWRGLGPSGQRRFLREHLRDWEVLRHRMPPCVADAVDRAFESARLRLIAGEVADIEAARHALFVALSTAGGPLTMHVEGLVIATGTVWDRRALAASPMWSKLIEDGFAVAHPSGIGVRTDLDGRLVDRAGLPVPGVVCLGAIRQGELWESTAIPEIREQVAHAARLLSRHRSAGCIPAPTRV